MVNEKLTAAESAELDAYGHLDGRARLAGTLPPRAAELWTRELLYGSEVAVEKPFAGLVARVGGEEVKGLTVSFEEPPHVN